MILIKNIFATALSALLFFSCAEEQFIDEHGKLVPKTKANEFFGFYNIFGKFASIMGPLLVGATAQLTGKSSSGVFSLIILFIIGIIILAYVPEPKTIQKVN